jgi:nicotinamide riboside kinase
VRISIIGAHGVGKTTLAKNLAEEINFQLIPDTAAEAFHKGFAVNENTTLENQFWILCKQIEYERAAKTRFIADKALFDNIVYSKQIFKDPAALKVIEKIVFANAKYDLLLYIPIEIELVDDGRSIDPKFQKFIDQQYLQLMEKLKLKMIEVRGSVEQRVNKALQTIKNHPLFIHQES